MIKIILNENNLSVFNKYAPIKKKHIRVNEAFFMTKKPA